MLLPFICGLWCSASLVLPVSCVCIQSEAVLIIEPAAIIVMTPVFFEMSESALVEETIVVVTLVISVVTA